LEKLVLDMILHPVPRDGAHKIKNQNKAYLSRGWAMDLSK